MKNVAHVKDVVIVKSSWDLQRIFSSVTISYRIASINEESCKITVDQMQPEKNPEVITFTINIIDLKMRWQIRLG